LKQIEKSEFKRGQTISNSAQILTAPKDVFPCSKNSKENIDGNSLR
jgi:hypothetical protein